MKKDAAELMGISQRALSYYLAKYRIHLRWNRVIELSQESGNWINGWLVGWMDGWMDGFDCTPMAIYPITQLSFTRLPDYPIIQLPDSFNLVTSVRQPLAMCHVACGAGAAYGALCGRHTFFVLRRAAVSRLPAALEPSRKRA